MLWLGCGQEALTSGCRADTQHRDHQALVWVMDGPQDDDSATLQGGLGGNGAAGLGVMTISGDTNNQEDPACYKI